MKTLIIYLFLFALIVLQKPVPKKYEIIKLEKDSEGLVNHLDVYVPIMVNIKSINNLLFAQYKKAGTMTLQIYYYDNKQIARIYVTKLGDKYTTDDEAEMMSRHVTGKFEYLRLQNSTKLHIGKGADNY